MSDDYKCLVLVMLSGGNHAHNTVIPTDPAAHAGYVRSAGADVTMPLPSLIPLKGAPVGLHPSLAGIASLYNAGRAAVVANVGPLVEPITKAQWDATPKGARVPYSLFSHNDQAAIWQTGVAEAAGATTGWAGRLADALIAHNPAAVVSPCLSLAGRPIALAGRVTQPYQVDIAGPQPIAQPLIKAVAMSPHLRTNLHERALGDVFNRALMSFDASGKAIAASMPPGFPNTSLGNQLKMAARLIAGRQLLGHGRQVIFVQLGGFDAHSNVMADHAAKLGEVDGALAAFHGHMASLGVDHSVTSATMSDFGRALQTNGDGFDHGWGGHHFVIGGAVKSGIHGRWPDVRIGSADDAGQGRLIPTTSVHQYAATLASWMGLPDDQMQAVFPGLEAFTPRRLDFV